MQPLKPLEIPLSGKNLIQASAGTGKTWTISLLYLRLLLEQQLTVDQLLVVTYTRAATEELRERIRERLKQAVAAYEKPEQAKDEYQQLLTLYPPEETGQHLWYLRRALLSFDEAAVFTIHGFCQRALQENAFDVGLPFDSELVQDEAELQIALADQFWQQRMLAPGALDLSVLETASITPDSLLSDVRNFIGKPYLVPVRAEPVSADDFTRVKQDYEAVLANAALIWEQQKTRILDALSPAVMNQTAYKPAQLETAVLVLEALFAGRLESDAEKVLLKFTPAYIESKVKKGQNPPQHAFFQVCGQLLQQLETLQAMQDNALEQLRFDLLRWLQEQLPQRKRQAGLLAFDDLLVNLQDALELRPSLAAALAKQYQVALIDEFQDTDPVQYRVFEHIYAESEGRLFYVGDPKQAIYGFRGADIHTYLYAADSVAQQQQYTLDRNFRSRPELIAAFNHLYSFSADPFRNDGRIGYEQVSPGGVVNGGLNSPDNIAPLRLWDWDNRDAEAGVQEVIAQIAQAVANDIARLLLQGQQGEADINGRPLASGDFAVLVRSHKQGRLIKQALQHCGIASVQQSPLGIFETPEAGELRILLAAIAEPGNLPKIKRALVTELMGGDMQALIDLDEQPQRLEQLLEDFYRWQRLWQQHGFMAMLHDWINSCGVYARLLAYVDGERRLTNLLHLGELIHAETREQLSGMQATLRWLQQRAEKSGSQDEYQLRLESDENLVQIITIHKSKGLQYPIVYCPFLWNGNKFPNGKRWFSWYDAQAGQSCLQAGKERLEEALASYKSEEMSEDLRLLYVALTRAQYQCTVVLASGEIPRFNYHSALGWLLFGHLPDADNILAGKTQMAAAERQQRMQEQLQFLAGGSAGNIAYQSLPPAEPVVRYQSEQDVQQLQARQFRHVIPPVVRIGSFSGLTSGSHDERPDYDVAESLELGSVQPVDRSRTHFPGGTRAGVCLHKMLERLDFQQPVAEQREDVVARSLQEQGYEAYWYEAAETLLQNTVHSRLLEDKTLTLAGVSKEERLDELEFYFPVANLQMANLKQILSIGLPDGEGWDVIREAVQRLSFNDLRGFMKGFVDLVFRADGCFYVVDYKSNWLGEEAEDYAQASLFQAMAHSHYYLQYLIYCVALHRYLRQRLGDSYSWDEQVGGVLYLFLRGMRPDSADRNGVFFHKPEAGLIEALDKLFAIG
ncbi:MAG: exodeoxyribonuclease V subunit beta [Thiolinea sp.]